MQDEDQINENRDTVDESMDTVGLTAITESKITPSEWLANVAERMNHFIENCEAIDLDTLMTESQYEAAMEEFYLS